MKHTKRLKPVTLAEAMDRKKDLTQLALEERSGVDRTRISKLQSGRATRVMKETYDGLEKALRELGALKSGEVLVIGKGA